MGPVPLLEWLHGDSLPPKVTGGDRVLTQPPPQAPSKLHIWQSSSRDGGGRLLCFPKPKLETIHMSPALVV